MAPVVERVQETVAVVLLNLIVNVVLSLHSAVTKGLPALLQAAREEAPRLPERAQQLAAAGFANAPEAWAWLKQQASKAEAALHRTDEAAVDALERCKVFLSATAWQLEALARAELANLPARKEAARRALGPALSALRAHADASLPALKALAASLTEKAAAWGPVLKAEAARRGIVFGAAPARDSSTPAAKLAAAGTAPAHEPDVGAPASVAAPAPQPEDVPALASNAAPEPSCPHAAPQHDMAAPGTPLPPIAATLEAAPAREAADGKKVAHVEGAERETVSEVAVSLGAAEETAPTEAAGEETPAGEAAVEGLETSTPETPGAPQGVAPEPSEAAAPAPAQAATGTAPVEAAGAPVEAAPVEAAPVEAAPVEAAPVEAAPVEAAPVEATAAPAAQSGAQEQAQKPAVRGSIPVPEIRSRIVRSTTLNSTILLPPNTCTGVPSSPAVKPRSSGRRFLFSPRVHSMSHAGEAQLDAYASETECDSTRSRACAQRARAVDSRLEAQEAQRVLAMEAARAVRAKEAKAKESHKRSKGPQVVEDPFGGYASDTNKLSRSRSSRSFWSSRDVPAARSRRT